MAAVVALAVPDWWLAAVRLSAVARVSKGAARRVCCSSGWRPDLAVCAKLMGIKYQTLFVAGGVFVGRIGVCGEVLVERDTKALSWGKCPRSMPRIICVLFNVH